VEAPTAIGPSVKEFAAQKQKRVHGLCHVP
jgi:hypothetical protein